jgi:hypothetical protein
MEEKGKDFEVKAKKNGKNLDVSIDTPKVDVSLHKDENKKHFKYDGEKLDVEVSKDAEGTKVDVNAESGFLKKIGGIIAKLVTRKFRK